PTPSPASWPPRADGCSGCRPNQRPVDRSVAVSARRERFALAQRDLLSMGVIALVDARLLTCLSGGWHVCLLLKGATRQGGSRSGYSRGPVCQVIHCREGMTTNGNATSAVIVAI